MARGMASRKGCADLAEPGRATFFGVQSGDVRDLASDGFDLTAHECGMAKLGDQMREVAGPHLRWAVAIPSGQGGRTLPQSWKERATPGAFPVHKKSREDRLVRDTAPLQPARNVGSVTLRTMSLPYANLSPPQSVDTARKIHFRGERQGRQFHSNVVVCSRQETANSP
jgi:hypothetical protein